ncbi:MAG: AAA domain-containing protein [Vicinamibacterales bacterium]
MDLDSPTVPPVLNESYESRDLKGEAILGDVTPEAQQAWDHYLVNEWTAWSQKAVVARQMRPLYQRLFSIHQQTHGATDTFDLFVGVGLFHSKTDADHLYRRHVLTFPAELTIDERTGMLSLGPSADFTTARFETDFIPTSQRARLQAQIEKLQPELEGVGASISDRKTLDDLLSRLITPVSATTSYVPDLAVVDAPAKGSLLSFAAALVLRPRSTRSLEALLERIEKDTSGPEPLQSLKDLPIPWRKMVEDGDTWDAASLERGSRSSATAAGRIYFPLPSNEEQSRIVQKAEGTPGVVVQGPPGTGKSHTIANLISHYLAMGRRVLVTAQSAPALEVLRDKMPKDLQQLCVTLLGDSRVSDRTLRRSVDGILSRQQDFRPKDYDGKIQAGEQLLTASETRIISLERTLHDSRATETEIREPIPGYRGTRASIARQLRTERSSFSWLRDRIPHHLECPTFAEGWEGLASYHASLSAEARAGLARHLAPLPFSSDLALDSVRRILSARAAVDAIVPLSHISAVPGQMPPDDLQGTLQWLNALADAEGLEAEDDRPWVTELRRVLLRAKPAWDARLHECRMALEHLTETVVSATVKVDVNGRTTTEARRDLAKLEAHYASGGSRRTFWGGRPAVVKETDWVEQAVSVGGANVQAPEDVSAASLALKGWALLDGAWAPWSAWPINRQGSARTQIAVLKSRAELLTRLLDVASIGSTIRIELREWLTHGLEAGASSAHLFASLRRSLAEISLVSARAHRDGLMADCRQAIGTRNPAPAMSAILDSLEREDASSLVLAFSALTEEATRRERHKTYTDFLSRVRKSAPLLADDIVAAEGTSVLRPAFVSLTQAWQHRRAQDWLDTMLSAERIEATHRAVREERQRQQEILAELSCDKAWSAALARINDLQRATLTAWARAVAAIPQTGKSIFTKRAHAQRLLAGCLSSIPAWVVSLNRLYETVEPVPGLFDVAIVDEASQCWIDSLVLFYLAKQVIIVGDDKQISPTVVGVADSQIEDLARTYLPDFQFRSGFTLTSSLFDHGRTYLSDGVPLREHFRCVPEIISFSNQLCYTGSLIPLRQVARNRLEPLKRTYLPDGLRTGDINDIEARAIVDTIAACHHDPDYEDADFGVICLQGDQQGERVEQLLLEQLGPEVFARRRLRSGNPYAFQGDERDVMFISMVVAPNQAHQTLTSPMYEQRFNVAMSRARDQAWLFHSVQEDDLGPKCLRRRVLDHFKNPPDQAIGGSTLNAPQLQLTAERADRTTERAPTPFDSWFEVDVALALNSRGYTVSAQVRVATKKIDLVVEGDEGVRLAVECDGDAWHGAEQYDADLARQRQLERAGWRFVRVRECLFYADEARAIQEVVQACGELDIVPGRDRRRLPTTSTAVPAWGQGRPSADTGAQPDASVAAEALVSLDSDEAIEAPDMASDDLSDGDDGETRARSVAIDRDYPDPRTAPVANIREAVLDVIASHGPLTKLAIYGHYRDGCQRIERAGKNVRQALNSALGILERMERVQSRDEGRRRLVGEVVYRLPEQRWVHLRPSDSRDLTEVPLSELAAAILDEGAEEVRHDEQALENILKGIARRYGALRFRDQARTRLTAAANLAFDCERQQTLGGLR